MALYIGNRKIASLTQNFDPNMVEGPELSVSDIGKLQAVPAEIMKSIGDIINNSEDMDFSDYDEDPVDTFVNAIWEKLKNMSEQGQIQENVGIGGNMIDSRSNQIFYRPLCRMSTINNILTSQLSSCMQTTD